MKLIITDIDFPILAGWVWVKMSWRKKYQHKKDWVTWLMVCQSYQDKYKADEGDFRYVKIRSFRNRTIRDEVNFRIGAKPLIDALVQLKLLWDDSDKYCHIDYEQIQVKRGEEKTEIIISDSAIEIKKGGEND